MAYPAHEYPAPDHPASDDPVTQRIPCSVCGLDTFRHKGWFLVVENRWFDRLKILSWHSALATQKDIRSACCRQHLKTLIGHWLNQASLRLPPARLSPLPIGSDPAVSDPDLGPEAVGRLVGELAVHRESFSRVWSGSPAALECILDALISIGAENKPHALECQLFNLTSNLAPDFLANDLPTESLHGLSLH